MTLYKLNYVQCNVDYNVKYMLKCTIKVYSHNRPTYIRPRPTVCTSLINYNLYVHNYMCVNFVFAYIVQCINVGCEAGVTVSLMVFTLVADNNNILASSLPS